MSDDIEIWKPAHGLEGVLEVSNKARVRTTDRICNGTRNGIELTQFRKGKVVSPWVGAHGYMTISVMIGGARKKYLLHRLIGFAFIPGYVDGYTINHINGVKHDNRLENLEWVSLEKNTKLQWETGLADLRGDNHPSRKLSQQKVRVIRRLLSIWANANELSILCDVSASIISLIRDGHRWKDVCNAA